MLPKGRRPRASPWQDRRGQVPARLTIKLARQQPVSGKKRQPPHSQAADLRERPLRVAATPNVIAEGSEPMTAAKATSSRRVPASGGKSLNAPPNCGSPYPTKGTPFETRGFVLPVRKAEMDGSVTSECRSPSHCGFTKLSAPPPLSESRGLHCECSRSPYQIVQTETLPLAMPPRQRTEFLTTAYQQALRRPLRLAVRTRPSHG